MLSTRVTWALRQQGDARSHLSGLGLPGKASLQRPSWRWRCANRSSRAVEWPSEEEDREGPTMAPPQLRRAAAGPPCTAAAQSHLQRRALLSLAALTALTDLSMVGPAKASKLPEAVDRGWAAIGGGPSDLVFPQDFLGTWNVESVLTSVELPLGPEFVPDMAVVQRAQREDLNQRIRYQVAFVRNGRGEVVPDRRFNTASLLHTYTGQANADVMKRIQWNLDDPNMLQIHLPGGLEVMTRVMRRLEERPSQDRLTTSEYYEQMIESPEKATPRVKGSQCFTKYHWRSPGAGDQGPVIVATQVVSDYLTAFDDPGLMVRAGSKPVTIYTYKMAFWKAGQRTAQLTAQGPAAVH